VNKVFVSGEETARYQGRAGELVSGVPAALERLQHCAGDRYSDAGR
jgi:hypothetical protein